MKKEQYNTSYMGKPRNHSISKIIYAMSILWILVSCEEIPDYSEIDDGLKCTQLRGYVLNSINENLSYSDIKMDDKYCYLIHNEEETIISKYTSDDFKFIKDIAPKAGKYSFTNEVSQPKNGIYIFNQKGNLFQIEREKGDLKKIPLDLHHPPLSCNMLSSSQIIASTSHWSHKTPFYYLADSKYRWTNPDSIIQRSLVRHRALWINNICAHEKKERITVAYRFLNYLSFYDLEGNRQQTFKFGTNRKPYDMSLSNSNMIKFFIDIYGTDKFVYCLYSGSSDLEAPCKVLKLNWKGKHINTYQLDRPIQAFAVHKNNKRLLAISVNKQDRQEVICYQLK